MLLVELRARLSMSSVDAVAAFLHYSWATRYSLSDLKDVVDSMIEAGHRYRNIEQVLGCGSILVLGTSIKESVWIKVLPKSGPKFTQAMHHLKSAGMPGIAERYKDIGPRGIQHEFSALTQVVTVMGLQESDSVQQIFYSEPAVSGSSLRLSETHDDEALFQEFIDY